MTSHRPRKPQLSFIGMLRRSLVHRRARSLSALVALTVSAAVATALLTLYADLNAKLHKEFRNFGANVVVTASASITRSRPTRSREFKKPQAPTPSSRPSPTP